MLLFQKLHYDDFYFRCNEYVIPKKPRRDYVVRNLAITVEQIHGRRRPKMKVEMDPFFDVRDQVDEYRKYRKDMLA